LPKPFHIAGWIESIGDIMKLVYRGSLRYLEQLPKGDLPENAVKINESLTTQQLKNTSYLYFIPPGIFIGLILLVGHLLHGDLRFGIDWLRGAIGLGIFAVAFFLHEFLHAICAPWRAEVGWYFIPVQWSLFIHTTAPMSKARFITMSLFPNILLGVVPLIVWVVFPFDPMVSTILLLAAGLMTMSGFSDYMNAAHAWRQMPSGSKHQLSGFNYYWFMP